MGSSPKREEPGKTGAPCVKVQACVKVTGFLTGPSPAMGGLQIPRWLGSDPLSAWWLGLAPATLEFLVRFPNERNQGKQAHPVLKYRVPHGSQPAHSFIIGPAVINTHKSLQNTVTSHKTHKLLHTGLGLSSLTSIGIQHLCAGLNTKVDI